MNIVAHNLYAMNAQRQFGINSQAKYKSTEKLSSGYKINRAADDAAGLAISEKMRKQIRGLRQGTENAQDGISWVQIGDGALDEVHDMLHRMTQLTVKSLNGTNSDSDRAAMQAEFDQIQSEIDRVTKTTEFNTMNIFNEHKETYDQYKGNRIWDQAQTHQIVEGYNNSMTITYKMLTNDEPKSFSISVPAGKYTTSELIDEIDSALEANDMELAGFNLEYSANGKCNLNYEDGVSIESISGGLTYLLHDMSYGGSMGALIGTTIFSDTSELHITKYNNEMSFDIQDEDGNVSSASITLAEDRWYTRDQLIDEINKQLKAQIPDTTIKAEKFGQSIKLGSDDCIITGFTGDMFKIEEIKPIYTSVFYDNIKYGDVTLSNGTFTGGAVLVRSDKDVEYNKFVINSSNNTLVFQPNEDETATTITIPSGNYTASEMADKLNELFSANNLKLTAASYSNGSFDGLKITSKEKSTESKVGAMGGSAFNTLFVNRNYTQFNIDRELHVAAGLSYAHVASVASKDPINRTIIENENDKFSIKFNDDVFEIKLDAKTYTTLDDLKDEVKNKIAAAVAGTSYAGKYTVDIVDNRLDIQSEIKSGIKSITPGRVGTNTGFDEVFRQVKYVDKVVSNYGNASNPAKITLNTPHAGDSIYISDSKLNISLDGREHSVTLTTGDRTKQQIIDEINAQLAQHVDNNTFPKAQEDGNTFSFISSGTGDITYNFYDYDVKGETIEIEGDSIHKTQKYAKVVTNAIVPDEIEITSTNNTLRLKLNDDGSEKAITLAEKKYSRSELVSELQKKIDEAFGNGYGGAIVSLGSKNELVFTARPGNAATGAGEKSHIVMNTLTSSLLKDLSATKKPAMAIATETLKNNITLDGTNNVFKFSYTDEFGTKKDYLVTLAAKSYTPETLIKELNDKIKAAGAPVTASISSGQKITLTSNKVGNVGVSFKSEDNDAFMTVALKDYKTRAIIQPVQAMKSLIEIDGSHNSFNIEVDGEMKNLTIDSGLYSQSQFVSKLNEIFANNSINVTVSNQSGYLVFTNNKLGAGSLKLDSSTMGSSLSAIFGTHIEPGVKASFSPAGNLVLERTVKGGSLSVTSSSGNVFQTGSDKQYSAAPLVESASNDYSYIDGANITEPIVINDLNKDLKFDYKNDSGTHTVDVTLAAGSYSFAT